MANEVSPRIDGGDRVEIRTSGKPPTSLGTLAVAVVIVASLYVARKFCSRGPRDPSEFRARTAGFAAAPLASRSGAGGNCGRPNRLLNKIGGFFGLVTVRLAPLERGNFNAHASAVDNQ